MRKSNGHKRRFGIAFKILIICVVIASVLAITSCSESSDHKCLLGGQKLTTTSGTDFSNMVSNLTSGVHCYYLTGNITVSQTIKVPEGVFVGICRAGNYNITTQNGIELFEVVDTDTVGTEGYGTIDAGGIYIYNCGVHGSHAGNTYYKAEQSMIDLYADSGSNIYSRLATNRQLNIALMSDVVIDDESFIIPEGYTLRICLNSPDTADDPSLIHSLTIADGLDLTKNGGELVIINCLSSTYHECMHLDNNKVLPIDGQSSISMNQALAKINALQSGDVFWGYLVNDLEWQGELSVKEGVTVAICLNGFDANGSVKTGKVTETVTDAETGVTTEVTNNYGNILFFDCSNHLCQDINDTGEMLAIREGSLDWTIRTLKQIYGTSSNLIPVWLVLEEDVDVPVIDGFDFNVCLNGFKNRQPVKENKTDDGAVTGRVAYYNCASVENSLYHSCDLINLITQGTMQCNPIEVDNVNDLNELFSNFTTETPYLLHLTSDITGSGVVTPPENTMITICLNGYTMDGVTFDDSLGQLIFVYECDSRYCDKSGEKVVALDQNILDFLEMISSMTSVYIDSNTCIAVTENVVIPSNVFEIKDGYTLNLCTYGYSVTGVENDPSIALHSGCQNCTDTEPDEEEYAPPLVKPHSSVCFIPTFAGTEAIKLNASNLDQANSVLGSVSEEQGGAFYYLSSDIVGSGVLKATENTIAAICLNGYTISDSITLADGVFVYECKEQYCSELGETVYSFDQGIFDFFTAMYNMDPPEDTTQPMFNVNSDFAFALTEDVVIPENLFAIADGAVLYICTCGNDIVCGKDIMQSNDKVVIHHDCEAGHLGCDVCDRKNALPFNYDTYSDIIDNTGRVILPPGSYYYYLENDFQLTRTLTIPDGVDLHICLNGYDLQSAYIWSDSRTYGYGYPESTSTGIAMIEPGGVWNIYDCSEKMTGDISLKFFRKDKNGDGIRELLLTVSDDNEGFEGLGEGLGAVFAAYLSNIATNAGTINIYGGNFNSMIGFINTDNGVINIYRGNINSVGVGVFQISLNDSSSNTNSSIYIGEGTTLSAGLVGVYGMCGDVTLDGGTVNAGLIGIALTSESEDTETCLTLNGGSINVADSSQMLDTMTETWATVGISASDIDMNLGELSGISDSITAVTTNDNIVINGDVTVTAGDMTQQLETPYADMNLSHDTTVTVSESVTGNYTLSVEGTTQVGKNDIFSPAENCMKIINSEGEFVIMPVPSGGEYAKVHAMSASTKGEITVNLYAKAVSDIESRILLYVETVNSSEPLVYNLSEVERVVINGVDTYRLPISISAKDYESAITYYFVLLPAEEGVNDNYADFVGAKMGTNTVSVKEYLDQLIESSDIYGDKAADLALSMKNYCAAVAKHFAVSDSYQTPSELENAMDSVDVETVKDYAPTRDGDYENSIVVFKTATVMLKSTTSIRIYFDIAEGHTLDEIDVSVAFSVMDSAADYTNVTVGETGYKSRPYYVEISGIYAKDLNKIFSITIDTWTVHYSVMGYVHTVLKNPGAFGDDVVNVVKALNIYNEKAVVYFNCEHYYDNDCDIRCNGCGQLRTVPGHVAADPVIEKYVAPANCNSGNYDEVTYCSICGEEMSRVNKTVTASHTPGEPVIENRVESTCQSNGSYYTVTHCLDCGGLISNIRTELPCAPHTWGEESADGEIKCLVCSSICFADGHTVVTDAAVSATCTSTGLTEGKHCSVCFEVIVPQTVIPAKGHTPRASVIENNVAPTCTADGYYDSVVYCDTCGVELSRERTVVSAIDHTPGNSVILNNVAPTCTADGGYDTVVSCTVCGTELSREHTVTDPAKGHTPGEAVTENAVDGGCTSESRFDTVIYCTVCGEELSRTLTIVPATGAHTADGEAIIENDTRTCTEGGSYDSVIYCEDCGEELSRDTYSAEALGHSYVDGACTVCGESENDEGGAE